MAVLEKACVLSFQSPKCTVDRFTLPHNFIYDIPLQSRGITKEIDLLGSFPAFKSVGLTSDMTLPFIEANDFNFESVRKDPLQNILREKKEFLKQLKMQLGFFKANSTLDHNFGSSTRATPVKSRSCKDDFCVSNTSFVKLTEWIEVDPYPYFNGSHLWYAVGGGISHFSLSGQIVIVTPEGKSFDKIKITPMDRHSEKSHVSSLLTAECTPGERIFQVVTAKKKKRGVIGVRNLRGFNVFRVKPDENGSLKCRKLIEVTEPDNVLVCLDVSSGDGVNVCTVDRLNCVKVYDVSAGKCILDSKIKVRANRADEPEARFIQYSNHSSVVYVTTRRKIYLKDTREPFDTAGTVFNVHDAHYGCEDLSVTSPSALGDLLYCSSSHHSFALDPRRGWIKRWSHGLDDVPLYLNAGVTESMKELVVTGNLEIGSPTGIIHSWRQAGADLVPSKCSSPALLPSIRDTALWANSKGYWLEPSISKRIESSLSGMTIIPHKSGAFCTLLTLNAAGDVFSTDLVPDEQADADSFKIHKTSQVTLNGLPRIKKWERDHMKHLRKSTSELECASLEDRYFLCSILKRHLNADGLTRSKFLEWRKSFKSVYAPTTSHRAGKLRPFREHRLSELSSFKDWLANEILPTWDMDLLIDESRAHDAENFKKPTKMSLKRKASMAFGSSSEDE